VERFFAASGHRTRLSRDEPPENPFDPSAMYFHTRGGRNQEQRTLFRKTPNRPG